MCTNFFGPWEVFSKSASQKFYSKGFYRTSRKPIFGYYFNKRENWYTLSPIFRVTDQLPKSSSRGAPNSCPNFLVEHFWCAQIYLDEKKNLFVLDCIELQFPSFSDPYGPNRFFDTIPLLTLRSYRLLVIKSRALPVC